jgi:hypothetical protein
MSLPPVKHGVGSTAEDRISVDFGETLTWVGTVGADADGSPPAPNNEVRDDAVGADIAEKSDTHQFLPGLPHLIGHLACSLTEASPLSLCAEALENSNK